jgi:8-oxo-dGTP pyrophosphatase MutT (NUDIX family)
MVREERIHKIEVHVAGVVVRNNVGGTKSVLAAKRRNDRSLYSGMWECGGGQVHEGEDFETAVKRQYKEEFGIDVKVVQPVGTYKINTDGQVIPGLRFMCEAENPAAEIAVSRNEFEKGGWISEEQLESCDFIPGIKEEIRKVLR